MILSNLHTHTLHTDGKNTVPEMAEAAFQAGFRILGFSEHSYTPDADFLGLTPERFPQYQQDVAAVREAYAGRMDVFLGLEQDYLSPAPPAGLDYTIGSLHSFYKDGAEIVVDWGRDRQKDYIRRFYGGDPYAFCRDYYAHETRLLTVTKADIVGHFDLVTIYNEGEVLFSERDHRYRDAAFSALDALLEQDPIIEINTGAIGRGYRNAPYPSEPLLRRICEKNGRITFSSDSHATSTICAAFDEAEALAKACGFTSYFTLRRQNGAAVFTELPL